MANRKLPPNTRKRGEWYHMDATIDGVRYREPLNTKDWRDAGTLAKDRIAQIKAGKVASPAGRAFSRLPFQEAVEVYVAERKGKVADRTTQFETERLRPLRRHFGAKPLRTFKASDVAAYQQARVKVVAGRTVNMETSVLRRILKKAKLFALLADYPQPFPEHEREIGRALPAEEKLHLFRVAASRPEWLVAQCAAVLAANTTCRKVELRNLRWCDVDLFNQVANLNRSKTAAGRRQITLNGDALAALARLRERAEIAGTVEPEHYVFPACENGNLDPTKPQTTWRTAWRSLVRHAAYQAGRDAAAAALRAHQGLGAAKRAWRRAAASFVGLRFHDLRHQAITEMAEAGAPDSVIQSLAGHLSKRMMDHYSHVRRTAKKQVTDQLAGGLMNPKPATPKEAARATPAKVN
jgi:integrase